MTLASGYSIPTRRNRARSKGLGTNHVRVSPDGRWVACVLPYPGVVNVYEAATGRRVWQSPKDSTTSCGSVRTAVGWSPATTAVGLTVSAPGSLGLD